MVTRDALLQDAVRATGGRARPPAGPSDDVDGVTPGVVVEPSTIDEVAAALKWASASARSVVAAGSGTKDAWGQPPRPIDVLLRLERLNRILAHEASDLTATVEAGARLGDVNRQLALHGQCLPVDPPHGDRATIGGVLAANDAGPLRHRFGTPRDLLIGMTIVMADGQVSSSGGRVVKNVAGYDIGRLMTGSHGSLAVIVSATFKLAPIAPASRTMRVRVRRASDVTAFTDLLRQHQCEPETLEVHLSRHGGDERIDVLLRYASVAPAVDEACRQTHGHAEQIGATIDAAEGAAANAWWAAHEAAPGATGRLHLRIGWRPAEFERAAAALRAAVHGADVDWIGRAGIGSGLVGIDGDPSNHAAIVSALRTGAVFKHVVIVDAPASLRREVGVWDIPAPQRALWQSLKSACDPRDTLGAGRGPL